MEPPWLNFCTVLFISKYLTKKNKKCQFFWSFFFFLQLLGVRFADAYVHSKSRPGVCLLISAFSFYVKFAVKRLREPDSDRRPVLIW